MRLWEEISDSEENKKMWKTNVVQNKYKILVVSQFTLYASCSSNKPSFHNSMPAE